MASMSKDLPPVPPSEDQTLTIPKLAGPGLFKRLTTKLRKPSESSTNPRQSSSSPGPSPTDPQDPSSSSHKHHTMRPHGAAHGPAIENAFVSRDSRLAALRERGLLPSQAAPLRDAHGYHLPLSEQEHQLDQRLSVAVFNTTHIRVRSRYQPHHRRRHKEVY